MKKLKLVLSDLHIGKGRILSDGSLNVLEDFVAERQLVEFLEFYGSGPFYEADIELVLNGDILNTLGIDYKGYFSPILTEGISCEKLRAILKGHPKLIAALKDFNKLPNHKTTYIVGNHDVDMIWEKCKEIFSEAIGTCNFKNFQYVVDGVHYEHGQQFEATNRLNPKKIFMTKGLKEPIINLPWGSHFVLNFILPMKMERPAIDKVRPVQAFAKWVLLNDTIWALKTFFRGIAYFFATRFSKSLYRANNLITTFKIIKEITVAPPSWVKAAQKVLEQNPDVHTVVMGHTHYAKYVQFPDGREYLNSGTWTEVTSLDLTTLGNHTRYSYILVDYTHNPTRPHAYLREWKGRWHEDLDMYMG